MLNLGHTFPLINWTFTFRQVQAAAVYIERENLGGRPPAQIILCSVLMFQFMASQDWNFSEHEYVFRLW